jgi:hypothetical protein
VAPAFAAPAPPLPAPASLPSGVLGLFEHATAAATALRAPKNARFQTTRRTT